ncbi:hypothetical protein P280DRAFT_517917 [Massarina eburnea CBS 473.64]|uniref:Uncharacterized protein n=1 Tax=Massarina eburnea CBS 473.64 TaxID=1395130 RepID=A0A6A6RYB0_9PLEO|nr:hypothetical protein P280DRAFT_517917 [Massarina eburnea CBS 473.64]
MDTLTTAITSALISILAFYTRATKFLHSAITGTRFEYWLLDPLGRSVTFCMFVAVISFTNAFRLGLAEDIKEFWKWATGTRKGKLTYEAQRRYTNLERVVGEGGDTFVPMRRRFFDDDTRTVHFWGEDEAGEKESGKCYSGDKQAELQKKALFDLGPTTREGLMCGFGIGSGRVEELVGNGEERSRLRKEALKQLGQEERVE